MSRRSGPRFADKDMRQRRSPRGAHGLPPRQSEGTAVSRETAPRQLLHLVFGGELTDLHDVTFKDLARLDVVGIFPNDATAYAAWKAKAQAAVDNAHMRYSVVHLHRLLEPDADAPPR
jgi:hypothetical protein